MKRGYSWENSSASSFLTNLDILQQNEQSQRNISQVKRRGIQRYLVVVVDGGFTMSSRDLSPTRTEHVQQCLKAFIPSYFENNPISQLQVMLMKDEGVTSITTLCGNPQLHLININKAASCSGNISLKTSLTGAINSLKNTPHYGTREVLLILGSLTSVDTGSIYSTIKSLKKNNIVCSIIGLAAEMHICSEICKETQGEYRIIRNESHFTSLLNEHIHPPKIFAFKKEEAQKSGFIDIGFPELKLKFEEGVNISLCFCHKKERPPPFYICPRCKSIQCEIPNHCNICGLTLISASDLSHSYHYLFPLDLFREKDLNEIDESNLTSLDQHDLLDNFYNDIIPEKRNCFSCQCELTKAFECPNCLSLYCNECDVFIHNSIFICPGCE
jgi:transcription initiation factor TFIIH subunit 2